MSARPDRPAGHHRRAARRVRGDGRRRSSAPRTRRTSRSAATARPRCSTPPARWSCRPSTSRSTSARCRPPSPPCSARTTPPGVSWILNDPYAGGTHLPDITVITPAFDDGGELLGFAASRAHHADVGGRVPGSMPADSTTLDEEGVVIAPRVARRRRDRRARRADAPARAAPRRPARAARRQPHRRAAPARARRARRASTRCARRPPPCSTTPSGARAPASRRSTDGDARGRDVLEAREGDLELRARPRRSTATS